MLTDPRADTRGQDGTQASSDVPAPASMRREQRDGVQELQLSGDWRHAGISTVYGDVVAAEKALSGKQLLIDLSKVSHFDTAGGWLVKRLQIAAGDKGIKVEIKAPDSMGSLIDAIPDMKETEAPAARKHVAPFDRVFNPIGRLAYDLWDDLVAAMYILGSAVRGTQLKFNRSAGISPAAIVSQLDHMGVRAVPIIILMSFLIGAIIAQQGAFQLRYFGAEVFVVDLVGILQLREIGVLLTAIMIAGRSGSAITAEIGSMKMREEIDALKVMGLNPVGVLVFPRLVALTIALPLLTIIANFSALAGAAAVSWAYSGITLDVFTTRLREAIDMSTVISGMIKAPFMALVIGIVASVEGMKVGGSAESLGRQVTASVVKSIFVVILMDGLFAMFYAAIDF